VALAQRGAQVVHDEVQQIFGAGRSRWQRRRWWRRGQHSARAVSWLHRRGVTTKEIACGLPVQLVEREGGATLALSASAAAGSHIVGGELLEAPLPVLHTARA